MNIVGDFFVPGPPVAWHLTFKRGQWQPFLSTEALRYRDLVRKYARAAGLRRVPPGHEVVILINIHLDYRENFKCKDRRGYYAKRIPDITNVAKLIEDALKNIVFDDDIQTAAIQVHRWKCEPEDEKVHVFVYDVTEE